MEFQFTFTVPLLPNPGCTTAVVVQLVLFVWLTQFYPTRLHHQATYIAIRIYFFGRNSTNW